MFSQKSLDNYRSDSLQHRVNKVTRDLLLPASKTKKANNLYTITSNTSTNSLKNTNNKSQNELQKRISLLQCELKRKLNEDSIMRHLFKTKTPLELTHLDLYLQIRRLEDRIAQLTQNQNQLTQRVQLFQEELKQQEQLHIQNVQEINECLTLKENQWLQEKLKFIDEANRLKQASQNSRFLVEEMKKKNTQLLGRQKQIIEQTNIQRDSLNLTIIKLKSDYESNVAQLKKVASLNKCTNEEIVRLQDQVKHLSEDLQAYKDEKERLQTNIEQLEQTNHQMANRFAQARKEEHDKFSINYQKLRKDYQIQIETLIHGHQQLMQNERRENLQLQKQNKSVKDQIMVLKNNLNDKQKLFLQSRQTITMLQKKITQSNLEKDQSNQINGKLIRELKQIKYDSKELLQSKQKNKFEINDLKLIIQKLNKKIAQMQQQNLSISNKNVELKRQVQYSQSYHKLNDKVYNENYKTLGRIIEINHKIRHQLPDSQIFSKTINEESLTEVVSYLTELLQQYTCLMSKEKRLKQQYARERNIENRQVISVLQQCKYYLNNQTAQSMLNKYICILKQRKISNSQQNHQRIEVYHQLIECLMEMHSLKFYSSDNTNQPIIEKDSLDSTHLLKNESSKKLPKNISIDRQSSVKNSKGKQRVETESSVYDMPLRRRLMVDQQDKQNVNTNIGKVEEMGKREPKKYLNEVRERLSNKMNEKCKEKQELRSQVLKKYFRS